MPNYIYRDAEQKHVLATVLYAKLGLTGATNLFHDSEFANPVTWEEALNYKYDPTIIIDTPGTANLPLRIATVVVTTTSTEDGTVNQMIFNTAEASIINSQTLFVYGPPVEE